MAAGARYSGRETPSFFIFHSCTETIALPSTGAQGAAGKYLVADAVGEWVKLVCVEAGTWDVEGYSGTWTAEA